MGASGATARRKGLATEAAVRDYLRSYGLRAERIPPGETHDRGDLLVPAYDGVVSVKHYANVARAVSEGMRELPEMIANAGVKSGVLVVRRPGKPDPADMIVIQTLAAWVDTLR